MGSNLFKCKRPDNFYISIDCLFWSLDIELKNIKELYNNGKRIFRKRNKKA